MISADSLHSSFLSFSSLPNLPNLVGLNLYRKRLGFERRHRAGTALSTSKYRALKRLSHRDGPKAQIKGSSFVAKKAIPLIHGQSPLRIMFIEEEDHGIQKKTVRTQLGEADCDVMFYGASHMDDFSSLNEESRKESRIWGFLRKIIAFVLTSPSLSSLTNSSTA